MKRVQHLIGMNHANTHNPYTRLTGAIVLVISLAGGLCGLVAQASPSSIPVSTSASSAKDAPPSRNFGKATTVTQLATSLLHYNLLFTYDQVLCKNVGLPEETPKTCFSINIETGMRETPEESFLRTLTLLSAAFESALSNDNRNIRPARTPESWSVSRDEATTSLIAPQGRVDVVFYKNSRVLVFLFYAET